MHSIIRIGFYSFLAVSIASLVGVGSEISAQGKGKGGDRGGGGRGGGQAQVARPQAPQRQMPQMQRPQIQRQQPQMIRQQAQRPQFERRQMPQMQRPQIQRQPQFERRQMQAQRPQVERRQMPQMQRPQIQRQPQFERRQMQAQRPQVERRQMPQMDRGAGRERAQMLREDRGRQARTERVRPQVQRPDVIRSQPRGRERANATLGDRSAGAQRPELQLRNERGRGRQRDAQAALPGITDRSGRGGWRQRGGDSIAALPGITDGGRTRGGRWARGDRDGGQGDLLARTFDRGGRSRGGDVDLNRVNIGPFRERARELRQQARAEGWNFDERDFRRNVWEYNQREAWRDDILRSAISVNFGYANDYYYIPPPSYPVYYGVNYEPWNYNIGYTYYDPYYSSFYVQPYSYAYQPYDYYTSSYYYDDPYYIDDPYDDFLTVRIFSSNYGGSVISRIVGGLLASGYDQGYRDGLLARRAGYYDYSYYEDPYVYYEEPYSDEFYEETTYSFSEPYNSYSVYENRRCLSKGYELGYEDALYGNGEFDPYEAAAHVDLVSVYVGASWQLV